MVKEASPVLNALQLAAVNETSAVEFLEAQRWGETPCCPRCGDTSVYKMMSGQMRNKDYRWRCKRCKRMYSVRTNSVLEETRLPVRVWIFAIWKAASSKKGYSALQLSREMEITHKSALFVLRRLRHGLAEEFPVILTGTVEVDETYVGGRPRHRRAKHRGMGRGTEKTPVLGIVQRDGDVRFKMMERVTSERIGEVLAVNADQTCRIITDEFSAYKTPGLFFSGGTKP